MAMMAWGTQVIWDRILFIGDTKDRAMYSCNLDVGMIVLLDLMESQTHLGLCGNGNWVYGLHDGKLAKVRPNGSELQTIIYRDDSL